MAMPSAIPNTGMPGMTAGPPRRGAGVAAGVLLLFFGVAVVAWIVYDFVEFSDLSAGKFAQALVDPRIGVEPELFNEQVWALTVLMLVVGVLACAARAGARGAALLAGTMLLAVSARELVGLAVSDDFRDSYIGGNDLDVLIIGSWVVGLLVSVAVLALMLAAAPRTPVRPGGPGAAAGALLLFLGVVQLAWIVYYLASDRYPWNAKDYLRHLVDASHGVMPGTTGSGEIGGTYYSYQALFAVAMLLFGALALAGRRSAGGGAVALAAVVLYPDVRSMIGLTLGSDHPGSSSDNWYPSWSAAGADTPGKLSLATTVGEAVLCVVVIVLMAAAGRRALAAPGAWGAPLPPGPQGLYAPNPYQQPTVPGGYGVPPQGGFAQPPQGGYGVPPQGGFGPAPQAPSDVPPAPAAPPPMPPMPPAPPGT
ncbi:hypothetical protein AB0M28_24135 [Streptomyces sp. NPDC051940]|uniref:hypothetical protein n=1 Tax=Streptomyces sp. NPDC051940 TaxID=3155675 RepID=UPI003446B9AC